MGSIRCAVALIGLAALANAAALAQDSAAGSGKTFMKKNVFYLPIRIDERVRSTLKEVRLYFKDDKSKPWQLRGSVPPKQSFFEFRAERDGEYWFTVVTVDHQGQAVPPDVQREAPGLIVVLDTKPPKIRLQPLEKTAVGHIVQCAVTDDNVVADKTKFYYQTGDQVWRTLEAQPEDPHRYCIPAQAVFTGMVRVTAADLADNAVVHEINLSSVPAAPAEPEIPAAPVASTSEPPLPASPPSNIVTSTPPPIPPPQAFVIPAQPPTSASQKLTERPLPPAEPVKSHSAAKPPEANPPLPTSLFDPQPPRPLVPPQTKPNAAPPMNEPMANFPLQQISKKGDEEPDLPLPLTPPDAATAPPPLHDPFVRPTANVQPVQQITNAAVPNAPAPPQDFLAKKHLVNKRQLFLQYQLDQTGASGVGRVEIWLTRDRGQTWEKCGEDADRKSPAEITLPGEGLYGVSLVVSNGRGFGATPPASGDPADWWIEVDVTRPHAELLAVLPGVDENTGTMIVSWTARDRNLTPNSISLSCSVGADGPWQTIAKGLENQGQYRWSVPVEIGPQAYVRLETVDAAGNITESRTAQPVALDDLSRPRARIRAISTSGVSTTPPADY